MEVKYPFSWQNLYSSEYVRLHSSPYKYAKFVLKEHLITYLIAQPFKKRRVIYSSGRISNDGDVIIRIEGLLF